MAFPAPSLLQWGPVGSLAALFIMQQTLIRTVLILERHDLSGGSGNWVDRLCRNEIPVGREAMRDESLLGLD